jgi:hypothetical protein
MIAILDHLADQAKNHYFRVTNHTNARSLELPMWLGVWHTGRSPKPTSSHRPFALPGRRWQTRAARNRRDAEEQR